MARLGKITLLATAAEAARQWAKNNPDKAAGYIDKAGAVIDQRTKGKYSKQIQGASSKAKGAVSKGAAQPGGGPSAPSTPGSVSGGDTPAPPPPAAPGS